MKNNNIEIEITYAEPNNQIVLKKNIADNISLMQAVKQSGILDRINPKYKDQLKFGIYGNLVANPDDYILKDGDRVEIYRPLIADPKQIRLQKLSKLKKTKT